MDNNDVLRCKICGCYYKQYEPRFEDDVCPSCENKLLDEYASTRVDDDDFDHINALLAAEFEVEQMKYRKKYLLERLKEEYIDTVLWDILDYLLDFDDDELDRVLKFCEEIAKARHKA